jgi:hypothetical protein
VPEPALPIERPATTSSLVESFGGKRGLLDSGLPAVVFVFVNSVVQALRDDKQPYLAPALIAALATGAGIMVLRLARKETLQQAASGFLGLAVAAYFANRSGEARGFFLPGIFINIGYGVLFLGSAVVGWPIVGAIIGAVEGLGDRWRTDARLRRTFALVTVGWAVGVFGLRAAVQGALYLADRPGLLAAARLLMGWPLTILAVVVTLWATRRVTRAVLGSDPEPA